MKTTISLKIKRFVQIVVHKLALAIVARSAAAMALSTITTTTPSTPLPENTASAEPVTEPASNDGAPKDAAGDGEAKNSVVCVITKTRVAILLKASGFAAIAIDKNIPATDGSTVNAVGSSDPRCNPARFLHSFETPEAAENAFYEAVAISRDRGFTVEFNGCPNNAQLS